MSTRSMRRALAVGLTLMIAIAAFCVRQRRLFPPVPPHGVSRVTRGPLRHSRYPRPGSTRVVPVVTDRVGVMIGFVPQVPMPDGGYTMNSRFPLANAPAWVQNPSQYFALDVRFGSVAVHLPAPSPAPVSGAAVARRAGPIVVPPPGSTTIRPERTNTFVVRGKVRPADLPALRRTLSAQVGFSGIFSDPALVLNSAADDLCDPDQSPDTDFLENVKENSGPAELPKPAGRVLIAIVGDGFDKGTVTEAGSTFDSDFSKVVPSGGEGTAGEVSGGSWHGEMCAYDATIVGRNASIADIRISNQEIGALSDALVAYGILLKNLTEPGSKLKQKYQALVVSNSWTASDDDTSLGDTVPYFTDATHPFTKAVKDLVEQGADVVFSAGNQGCTEAPGIKVIGGANSLPEVITVGAIAGESLLPSSSQGPGTLFTDKPDVSSYGNFFATDASTSRDTGTSAAAALTAGIVAAMRSQAGWAAWGPSSKTPAALKVALISNANKQVSRGGAPLVLTGWVADFGFGIARFRE